MAHLNFFFLRQETRHDPLSQAVLRLSSVSVPELFCTELFHPTILVIRFFPHG